LLLLGTQRINEYGHLEIGGCDTVELARRFGTPLYVMDEETIRQACRSYRKAFENRYPRNLIHYASKAFLCLAMCRIAEQEGLGLDVSSGGELLTAMRANFPPERINLHGNNKSEDELRLALRYGVGHITIDNFEEIELLTRLVARRRQKRVQDVLVRCAPGVDPETHRFMRTGQADTKFGFNIADGSALEAVRRVAESKALRYRGLHFHVGSQLTDTEAHEGGLEAAVELMAEVYSRCGLLTEVLNIGGGLGVRYVSTAQHITVEEFAERIVAKLRALLERYRMPEPILAQEPGRAIVGEAGVTLYTVGAVKTVPILEEPGRRTYVSVDGGLSDNPRPQLYDAVYEAVCASRASEPHTETVAIAGKHCETDVLIWQAKCPPLWRGDILAIQTTGAYNYSMSSNYNRVPRPAVVLVVNGRAELIVRREALTEMLRNDVRPAHLFESPEVKRC